MTQPPISLRLKEGRRATAELFIDLCLAFHASAYPVGTEPSETDANLALVATAAMLGHAEGRPMNASEIAARLRMPRTSVLRRLNVLVKGGLLIRIEDRFYLEPDRAERVPYLDKFTLILTKALATLGPILSELDR